MLNWDPTSDVCTYTTHDGQTFPCGVPAWVRPWLTDAPERQESQMSDERLAEIEAEHGGHCTNSCCEGSHRCYGLGLCLIADLLAEVRRLRRALQLSEASRGVPVVGQD